ncbi:MAG TPA: DUF3037 domain-containing protein [Terriglobales bacterium]|nr:DUF3037 domain-containing protein [Terriglobales bacterium]
MRTAEPCACEFVLIRIAPDPIRNEAVNVGVALFQPEAGGFVGVRISPGWNHVRRLAPAFDPGDLEGLEAALLERFQAAAPAWRSREYFLQLGLESFSHCLQISPPTAVLTRDPAQELDRLYHAYAAPAAEPEAIVAAGARQLIRNHLNRVFREERIYDKLYRGARASLWLREPDRFRFHYHYQPRPEDTCHVIQALPLGGEDGYVKDFCFTVQRLRARLGEFDAASFEQSPPAVGEVRDYHLELLSGAGVRALGLDKAAEEAARIRHAFGMA